MNQKLAVLDGSDFCRLLYLLESDEESKWENIQRTITYALDHKTRLANGQILTVSEPYLVPETERVQVFPANVLTGSLIEAEGVGAGLYRWEVEEGLPVHYLHTSEGKVALKHDQRVTVLCDTFEMSRAALAALSLLDQALELVKADEKTQRDWWPDQELDLTLGRDIRKILSKFAEVSVS